MRNVRRQSACMVDILGRLFSVISDNAEAATMPASSPGLTSVAARPPEEVKESLYSSIDEQTVDISCLISCCCMSVIEAPVGFVAGEKALTLQEKSSFRMFVTRVNLFN